jgi:hypothetical protein
MLLCPDTGLFKTTTASLPAAGLKVKFPVIVSPAFCTDFATCAYVDVSGCGQAITHCVDVPSLYRK